MQSFLLIWCNLFLFIQFNLFFINLMQSFLFLSNVIFFISWIQSFLLIQCNVFYLFNAIFLLMWCNLRSCGWLAKFKSARGTSHHLPLMENYQIIWSYVCTLSIQWMVYLSVFFLCVTLGLLLWRDSKISGEYLTTWFDKKLQNVVFIHFCPNYWVNSWDIELKNSFEIAFSIEIEIIFAMVWIFIALMVLQESAHFPRKRSGLKLQWCIVIYKYA